MQTYIDIYARGNHVTKQVGYMVNGEYKPGCYTEYANWQSAYRINKSEYAALVEFRQENKTLQLSVYAPQVNLQAREDADYLISSTQITDNFGNGFIMGPSINDVHHAGAIYEYVADMPQHARACQLAIEEIKR